MRNSISKLALTVALMLAITFTFNCSGDSGGSGGNGDQSNISSGTEANAETSSSSKETSKSSSSSEAENNSSSSSLDSSSSSKSNSSSSKGSEVVGSVKKDKISGFSQKGPFTKGSAITLSELNDKLVQTGRSFEEMITDDKGSFEIKNIELVSPYATLKANGFYRNEVTGEISKSPINLYAIVDIREKSNVNVNILTHLEYYRVQKLVEAGKSLKDAKKQAQKEILAVFGISGQFKDSEDMSIFGTTDGDAALLAISVLLQGDLTEGQFTERLADFSLGFRETGVWDNKKEKDAIAEWAFNNKKIEYCDYAKTPQDPKNCYIMPTEDLCRGGKIVSNCSGGSESYTVLSLTKNNILGWKFSSTVPDFEKYVNNYWESYYDFGACDAKKAGEIKESPNGTKVICKNNAWVISKAEIELGPCTKEGEIKGGYICKNGEWNEPQIINCNVDLQERLNCSSNVVTLKVDECVKINVIAYNEPNLLSTIVMRCETQGTQSEVSVTLSLNGKSITTSGSWYVMRTVELEKIKVGDNEFGSLCLTAISGAMNVRCTVM